MGSLVQEFNKVKRLERIEEFKVFIRNCYPCVSQLHREIENEKQEA
jgi:hypothetical protein